MRRRGEGTRGYERAQEATRRGETQLGDTRRDGVGEPLCGGRSPSEACAKTPYSGGICSPFFSASFRSSRWSSRRFACDSPRIAKNTAGEERRV